MIRHTSNMLEGILKKLYLTKGLKLNYCKNESSEILECFVDSDWAGDSIDRKSTTGYVIKMFGNVVYWKSRKQSSVTKASPLLNMLRCLKL